MTMNVDVDIALPRDFERWNPALRGAYLKGVRAAQAGETLDACPYRDRRNDSGRLTWSRSFIRAWEDGWRDARAQASASAGIS